MGMKKIAAALAAFGLLASGSVHATLFDRGGGLLYDNVLDLTWLQDANYAMTSGYAVDGRMTAAAAGSWAANLIYHDTVRNVDWTDWRLPSVGPVNGISFNYGYGYDGSTDIGYNITNPVAQLSYMYYVNLGLKGFYSPARIYQPDNGVFGNGTSGGQADVGLVHNLQSATYWSEDAWRFSTLDGLQGGPSPFNEFYAWGVMPGDVGGSGGGGASALPEPMSVTLFGVSLAGLVLVRRRRRFDVS